MQQPNRRGKSGNFKEMDPELLMKIKFRAKCRFRAFYRMVAANAYWLMEDVDEYEGIDDVKRRVQQAVRGKSKGKQLLTIRDKALLNKPATDRTDTENKYIYRIIGGLKCFKKFPNHVKKKLAALTYFKYFGPGRVIVKQHQEAHALYFIVSGEAVVTQLVWDGLLQQMISTEFAVMRAGDMFGEVSLLHNIPRTATVTTTSHCEMLVLLKEDFKNVLLHSVQKDWDEVYRAMSMFTYFHGLDDIGMREGCIVAKLKSYERSDIILGDGEGFSNFVYFVLTGKCQMIESLQVIATKRVGKVHYTLYDPYVPSKESEEDMDAKYFACTESLNQSNYSSMPSVVSQQQKEQSSSAAIRTKTESILKPVRSLGPQRISSASKTVEANTLDTAKKMSIRSQVIMPPHNDQSQGQPRESVRLSTILEFDNANKTKTIPVHTNLKTIFMQVVQYNPGSTFGFGENMRDRRIVAMTPMECLLLPLVWLLQRNTANIWTRIVYFLEKKIPNKKALFNEFINERRWQEYRDQIVNEIISKSHNVNFTTLHDVPYSIRIDEMQDV